MHVIIAPLWGKPQTTHRAEEWATVPVITGGLSPHDRSRSYLAARALTESDAEHLVWLDDDMEVGPEHVERLLTSAREVDADVMSGAYCCRHAAAHGKVALSFNAIRTPGMPDEVRIGFGEAGGIFPINACGFGIVATHRRVFEIPMAPEADYTDHEGRTFSGRAWFLPLVRQRDHLGEDRSFCTRLFETGTARMFVDTRVTISHAGYRIEDML
jgi:hypothetical protein